MEIAPAGCYVALRVGFSYPAEELNRLPDPWVEYYTVKGLVVHDPMLRWVYANSGIVTWDRLAQDDPRGVLRHARRHGLSYGAVASIATPDAQGRRSYGLFARADRAFARDELDELLSTLTGLHETDGLPRNLTRAETEALRLQANGMRLREISSALDISMSAVKARLASAKRKLGAQNASQAAALARVRGVL
ncbi:MAG: autoinducer binding domain-containing protein [Rhodobacteraceae bacterium]|nr:autoinducer binding domain-containing protein [Paracoccaceae bacterium]